MVRGLLTSALVLLLVSSACKGGHTPAERAVVGPTPGQATSPTTAERENWEHFGAQIPKGEAVDLALILAQPDKFEGQTVIVEERIRQVCSRKGCWMELAESEDPKAKGCRVTFKDYGFFVPRDSQGDLARAFGVIKTKLLSASEVSHMEDERGSFDKKLPDGRAIEVRLVAGGVEIRRGG